MKNRYKKQILLIIIPIVLIVVGVIFTIFPLSKKELPTIKNYGLEETKKIVTCYSPDCKNSIEDIYANMSYDYESDLLQEKIRKINQDTADYYNLVINSTTEEKTCSSIRNYNKHSLRVSNHYHSYTTDQLISISVKRSKINICTDDVEAYQTEAYIYDIAEDKLLSVEETMKTLGITQKDIMEAIENTNKAFAESTGKTIVTKEHYDDIALFYNTVGKLYVSYFIDEINDYYSAPIEIK